MQYENMDQTDTDKNDDEGTEEKEGFRSTLARFKNAENASRVSHVPYDYSSALKHRFPEQHNYVQQQNYVPQSEKYAFKKKPTNNTSYSRPDYSKLRGVKDVRKQFDSDEQSVTNQQKFSNAKTNTELRISNNNRKVRGNTGSSEKSHTEVPRKTQYTRLDPDDVEFFNILKSLNLPSHCDKAVKHKQKNAYILSNNSHILGFDDYRIEKTGEKVHFDMRPRIYDYHLNAYRPIKTSDLEDMNGTITELTSVRVDDIYS